MAILLLVLLLASYRSGKWDSGRLLTWIKSLCGELSYWVLSWAILLDPSLLNVGALWLNPWMSSWSILIPWSSHSVSWLQIPSTCNKSIFLTQTSFPRKKVSLTRSRHICTLNCLPGINYWISNRFLELTMSKMKLLVFPQSHSGPVRKIKIALCSFQYREVS